MSTGKAKKKNFWKGIPHPVSKFPPPELGRRLFDYLQPRSSPNLVCWMAASVFFFWRVGWLFMFQSAVKSFDMGAQVLCIATFLSPAGARLLTNSLSLAVAATGL